MLRCNLKKIIDERGYSIRKVAVDIDYRFESVRRLCNNSAPLYHRELLDKLCAYLDIGIGELLEFVKEDN